MGKAIRFAVAGLAGMLLLAAAPAAMARPDARGGDPSVETRGACSAASTWKLTLKLQDPQRIETQFEVESGIAGQSWKVAFKDNGVLSFKGTATTGAGGSFEVRKFLADQTGTDTVDAFAKNVATGETCHGTASI